MRAKINNYYEKVVASLRDAYYRISVVDLKNNKIVNVKMDKKELEQEEAAAQEQYDSVIEFCAHHYVHPVDRIKFLQLSDRTYLLNAFQDNREEISFTYQRLVDGVYKWVKTIIVPAEDEEGDHSTIVWYIKNIDAQKVRENLLNEQIQQKNRVLSAALKDEEQYRQALLKGANISYDFNISKNKIDSPIMEYRKNQPIDLLKQAGLKIPCAYEEFVKHWKTTLLEDGRELFEKYFGSCESLLEAYAEGKRLISQDFSVLDGQGRTVYLQYNVLMTQNQASGDIMGLAFLKNITEEKMAELENNRIHEALGFDYTSVYSVNLQDDSYRVIKVDRNVNVAGMAYEKHHYQDIMESYVNHFVCEEYKDKLLYYISREFLQSYFKENKTFTYRYRVFPNAAGEEYFEIQIVAAGRMGETTHFVMGFRCVDSIAREEILQRERLEKARADAEQASRAKSLFLSNMSHDIRTPMNAVINMVKFMREDVDDREKLLEDLGKIETSSNFMLSLINDILDMAKIESGEMILQPVVVFHDEFLNSIQDVFEPLCAAKGITFVIKEHEVQPAIWMDKVRFYQIFYNILSNAVKFTPAGGKISYQEQVEDLGDGTIRAKFIISDTGIGMSREFQNRMFEPFECEDNKKSGTGLGLSIVKRIVELMNGTIVVESAPGEGTTMTLQLVMQVATEQQIDATLEKRGANIESLLQGMRILVAEDNMINQEILQHLLEEKGVIVDVAENGKETLEKYLSKGAFFYDAILMDIQMPIMNGLVATREIRKTKQEDARSIPIIALTANAFDDDREASKKAGMNAHLSKPVNIVQIEKTLSAEVARARYFRKMKDGK